MAVDSVARIISLSGLEASQIDKDITVQQTIGGIQAGTVYSQGTSVTTIMEDLLGGQPTPVEVTIYYGATDNPPTGVSGLTSKTVMSTALIGNYAQKISAGNPVTKKGQHPVFAVPTAYEVTKWYVPGFEYDIPHTRVVSGGYNIYYLKVPSYDEDDGGINYLLTVREVQ